MLRRFVGCRPYVPVLRYSLNTSSVPWPSASLDIAVLGNSGVDMTWYRENVNESLGPNCGQVTGFLVTFTYTNLSAGMVPTHVYTHHAQIHIHIQAYIMRVSRAYNVCLNRLFCLLIPVL